MDNSVETLSRDELIDLAKKLTDRQVGLTELVEQLLKRVNALEALVVELEAENERLRQQLGQKKPPSWNKPNRSKDEGRKEPRPRRAAEHNHNRRREEPTRTEQHALERCPECN
jgi:hypothetical protein